MEGGVSGQMEDPVSLCVLSTLVSLEWEPFSLTSK